MSNDGNWFDRYNIRRFRNIHKKIGGYLSPAEGYEGVVEEVKHYRKNFSPEEFESKTIQTLHLLFGKFNVMLLKIFIKFSPKIVLRLFVAATPISFRWLVGNMKRADKNSIKILYCKYLEKCGEDLCIYGCKLPTEKFFKNTVGLGIELTPNFENKSCYITYYMLDESSSKTN
ncbi:MAG: hypothetical protein Tsb005_15860 [Gammaproteobacteria bacterium]